MKKGRVSRSYIETAQKYSKRADRRNVAVQGSGFTRKKSSLTIEIRRMRSGDLEEISRIHSSVFPRQTRSFEWISCNFRAFPRIQVFVASAADRLVGYIIWTEKGGFREKAVYELEQIAVLPNEQGNGIGNVLIEESLIQLKEHLSSHGSSLSRILVSTRTDNQAQRLYQRTLGVEPVAVIPNLYSADEVILVFRTD